MYDGTFHEAVSFLLAFAQCFGVMPVSGIREKSPRKLKFRKFSFRFILSIFYIIGIAFLAVLDINWIFETKVEFGKLVNLIFDTTNVASLIFFLELAGKWPELMVKWNELENFLPQLKYQMDKQKLAYKIKMVSIMILCISMGKNCQFL